MRWLILLIFCCSFVSAVDIEFNQNNYASFETVLVKINFTEDLVGSLTATNIYVDDVTIAGKKVIKIDDLYYVYFYLPSLEDGTYNFKIKDVTVREDGLIKRNFDKKFNIVEHSSISLRPGVIYLDLKENEQPKLGFDITNRGNFIDFTLSTDGGFLVLDEKSFKLNPGNDKKITVGTNFKDLNESMLYGSFNVIYSGFAYKVPVIVKRPVTKEVVVDDVVPVEDEIPVEVEIPSNALVFDVIKNGGNKIDLVLGKSDVKSGEMYFRNDYTADLTNLSFELKGLDNIITYKYSGDYILKPKEVESVSLEINTNKDLDKDYSGVLIVSASGLNVELPVIIKLKKEEEVKPVLNETIKEQLPVVEKKTSKAWIVFAVLGVFVVIFFVMYFKGKKDKKDFNRFISQVSRK